MRPEGRRPHLILMDTRRKKSPPLPDSPDSGSVERHFLESARASSCEVVTGRGAAGVVPAHGRHAGDFFGHREGRMYRSSTGEAGGGV